MIGCLYMYFRVSMATKGQPGMMHYLAADYSLACGPPEILTSDTANYWCIPH